MGGCLFIYDWIWQGRLKLSTTATAKAVNQNHFAWCITLDCHCCTSAELTTNRHLTRSLIPFIYAVFPQLHWVFHVCMSTHPCLVPWCVPVNNCTSVCIHRCHKSPAKRKSIILIRPQNPLPCGEERWSIVQLCGLIWSCGWSSNCKREKGLFFWSTSDRMEGLCLCTTWLHRNFSLPCQRFFHINYSEKCFLSFLTRVKQFNFLFHYGKKGYYIIRLHMFPVTYADVTVFHYCLSTSPPPTLTISEQHGSH